MRFFGFSRLAEARRLVLARWCNTQPISQTSGETAAPRTVAAFSGPSTGCPLGRSGLSKGPNHPQHAPLGPLGWFGVLINGLPPPDLDHSPTWKGLMKCSQCHDYNKGVRRGKCIHCGFDRFSVNCAEPHVAFEPRSHDAISWCATEALSSWDASAGLAAGDRLSLAFGVGAGAGPACAGWD